MPRFEEFGRFIDAIDIRQENLFRFVFLGLNTWARPQTIIDFRDNAKLQKHTKRVLFACKSRSEGD